MHQNYRNHYRCTILQKYSENNGVESDNRLLKLYLKLSYYCLFPFLILFRFKLYLYLKVKQCLALRANKITISFLPQIIPIIPQLSMLQLLRYLYFQALLMHPPTITFITICFMAEFFLTKYALLRLLFVHQTLLLNVHNYLYINKIMLIKYIFYIE